MSGRLAALRFYFVAAIFSAGLAGIAGGALAGVVLAGPGGLFVGLLIAPYTLWIGLKWVLLPALLLGAALCELGKRHPAWQRLRVWASVGALAGLAMFLLPWPGDVEEIVRSPDFHDKQAFMAPLFALAGVGGALAFRLAAWWSDVFPYPLPAETFRPV